MPEFDKSRKIAFLPGTSGLGKALAKNLAKSGFKILIGGVKLGEAKATVKEISKAAGSACPFIEAMDMKGAAASAKVIFFAVPVSSLPPARLHGSNQAVCSSEIQVQAEASIALLSTGQSSR